MNVLSDQENQAVNRRNIKDVSIKKAKLTVEPARRALGDLGNSLTRRVTRQTAGKQKAKNDNGEPLMSTRSTMQQLALKRKAAPRPIEKLGLGVLAGNTFTDEDLLAIARHALGDENEQSYRHLMQQDPVFSTEQVEYGVSHFETTEYCLEILFHEQNKERDAAYALRQFMQPVGTCCEAPVISHATLARACNWIVFVQDMFGLLHETVHLAIGLLYAYLSRVDDVARVHMPLVVASTLWIAIKFEERHAPDGAEIIELLHEGYDNDTSQPLNLTKHDLYEGECVVLRSIEFAVCRPNGYVLYRRYSRVLDTDSVVVQFVGRFLMETGLYSYHAMMAGETKRSCASLVLARTVSYLENNANDEESEVEFDEEYLWPAVLRFFTREDVLDDELFTLVEHLHYKTNWLMMHFSENESRLSDPSNVETSMDASMHPDREWGSFDKTVEKYLNSAFYEAASLYHTHGSNALKLIASLKHRRDSADSGQ